MDVAHRPYFLCVAWLRRPRASKPIVCVLICAAFALLMFAPSAAAQPVRSRLLVGLDARLRGAERGAGWEVIVRFSAPVRYLRHSPLGAAESVQVQLAILRSDLNSVQRSGLETLRAERDPGTPLRDADLEILESNRAVLDLHFRSPQAVEIWQGEDFRSLAVRSVQAPGADAASDAGEQTEGPRSSVLLREARHALTARDHQRAVLILREILSLPGHESTQEAHELLGLAHERSDQRAHAVAEYRAYLKRYPEGPAAERVKQRLQALLTARERPQVQPFRVQAEEPPLDWDMLGSLYVGYRRESRLSDNEQIPLDDSLFADLHHRTRVRTDRWNFRSELSGGYRHSFLESADADARISRLFGRIEHEPSGLSATLGRQTRSSGGVLGRFDGFLASYSPIPEVALSVVSGYPVDSSKLEIADFDRYFFGASVDGSRLFGWLDAQIFFIDQRAGGYEERRAVGGELRFVQPGRFASAYVDYDLLFQSLNIAQLTANWNATPNTFVNLLIDYRNSPILTLTSSLISQPETEIGQLVARLAMDEILELAKEGTARSTLVNIGASHRFTDRIQLAGDFSLSRFSQIEAFEDFEGVGGDGFEFTYYAQLLVSELFFAGDAATASLRFFDGNTFRSVAGSADMRWRIGRALRLNPRLRAETRWGTEAVRLTTVKPSLRGDWRVWKLVFDVDCGIEWRTPERDDGRWGYYVSLGARYDF